MKQVAVMRAHSLAPDNCWGSGFADLIVEAGAPVVDGVAIDGVFAAGTVLPGREADCANLAADRLGLDPAIALTFDGADVSGAAAFYAAWQNVRSGACRTALVIAAAKVSDASEAERLTLMNCTLDQEADVARGLDFATQAGLLADHCCREKKCEPGVFAEISASNLAAWAAHCGKSAPTRAELRHDLPVAPPLVRSDFAQLLDGACALLLTEADRDERPRAIVEAVASATDLVSVWERKAPLAFAAVEKAAARVAFEDTRPDWLEIDAATSVAQFLSEQALSGKGKGGRPASRINRHGGAQGRGRVFGASALYQIADICEIAGPGERAILLAVGGLGSHVYGSRVVGAA